MDCYTFRTSSEQKLLLLAQLLIPLCECRLSQSALSEIYRALDQPTLKPRWHQAYHASCTRFWIVWCSNCANTMQIFSMARLIGVEVSNFSVEEMNSTLYFWNSAIMLAKSRMEFLIASERRNVPCRTHSCPHRFISDILTSYAQKEQAANIAGGVLKRSR